MVASSPSLAPIRSGSLPGQCGACGLEDSAEWGIVMRRHRDRFGEGYFRLCDDCKTAAIEFLKTRPDRGTHRLKGYS